jgi:hypothetical protein
LTKKVDRSVSISLDICDKVVDTRIMTTTQTQETKTMTIETLHAGNSAIETQKFTISIRDAKVIRAYMKRELGISNGSYWHTNFVRPVNIAVRRKQDTVTVYTAGFGSSELYQIAAACGVSK